MSAYHGEQGILPFGRGEGRCLEPGWRHPALGEAKAALARLRKFGHARTYSEAHLVARLHLGLLGPLPVACKHCTNTDYDTDLEAALNWPEIPPDRLRADYAGRIFSSQPELDYIALCRSCHRRLDSWRKALPAGIQYVSATDGSA